VEPRKRRGAERNGGPSSSTYTRLKQAILSGEIGEGESLVESVLAERFEVSRTPVREALTRLEHDGLVERRDRGLEVRSRSPEEILDIYETRIVLEAKAAAVACERRTDFDLMRLRQLLERGEALRDAADVDPDVLAEHNREFHGAVWRASRNESLIDLLDRLNLHLMRYPRTTLSADGRWGRAVVEHRALVDALAARDGERAAEIAAQHFVEARDIRLRLWQEELT
jgi:DNA-binding GntR family transcriptional regulator